MTSETRRPRARQLLRCSTSSISFCISIPSLWENWLWQELTGICKMCLETKVLESSHFIPNALYDYCYGSGGEQPIVISSDAVYSSSREIQHPLLCKDCEDILNKNGESWMNSKLAAYEKKYPLYDLVVSGQLIFDEGDCRVFCATENPLIDADKIAHFAMGIFWKASIHSWRGRRGRADD